MEDTLIRILEDMGYEVYRQGSMTDDIEYPAHFFTFWNNPSEETRFYDNKATAEELDFDVNFYSTDPAETYEVIRSAKKKLRDNGFIIYDSGHDVGSDQPTHTGRGIGVIYVEDIKNERY